MDSQSPATPATPTTPTQAPNPTHHHIVFLQGAYNRVPEFNLPAPHTLTKTVYQKTTPPDLHARIHDASILVFSSIKLDATSLSAPITPNLKCIMIVATGTDCVDLEACKARGITVCNCPGANFESVAEHAVALYFATRRKLPLMRALTMDGEWVKRGFLMSPMLDAGGHPPRTCREEVVGIMGYGSVGKHIAQVARALGMTVLIAEHKDPATANETNTVDRVPFDQVLEKATVIFLAIPLNDSTRDFISTPELNRMHQHSILINIARGGVVNEHALVAALKENKIFGAATDVFPVEPAGPENSPLLSEDARDLNLVVTPHLAWLAETTWVNQCRWLGENVERWVDGRALNVVV